MRLIVAVVGSMKRIMEAERKAGEAAAFAGVDAATQGMKGELRGQIERAGLGRRLANTWRSKTYPADRRSLKPGGFVWSKAPEIVSTFAEGAKITAKNGQFLAIPLPAAGKYADGRKRVTPGSWERAHGQRLRFVYRRGRNSLLVAEGARLNTRGVAVARKGKGSATRGVTIPIFVLVPQVRIRKRLDIDAAVDKWGGMVPTLIAAAWRTPAVRGHG